MRPGEDMAWIGMQGPRILPDTCRCRVANGSIQKDDCRICSFEDVRKNFVLSVDLLCCSMCSAWNASIELCFQSINTNSHVAPKPYRICI